MGLMDAAKSPYDLRGNGAWLAVAVVPGSVQDRDCLETLSAGKERWPSLRDAVLDRAFAAERCRLHGIRHRMVERARGQKEFVVLERRWAVIVKQRGPKPAMIASTAADKGKQLHLSF